MRILADLHIHSRFSMATSKKMDVENIYIAARKKGITVIGTGDFTHPQWLEELKRKLVQAEDGLYRLNNKTFIRTRSFVPIECRGITRFILSAEICNIYEKNGKTRKIHSVILLPEISLVEKLNHKFKKRGKLESDGRPVFKLDVVDMLETIFGVSERAMVFPAHIWTPWYSLFGSRSGFDSTEECFGDYIEYVFAVETGLSSDPDMCRNFSGLNEMALISNSDAHSPMKIGREATIIEAGLSYNSILSAIKTNSPENFIGTVEYYPEEGKYYADGHRKCNVSFLPQETLEHGGICPVCGKSLTIGVLHRIEVLSGKSESEPTGTSCFKTIPLIEILSEILRLNKGSKKILMHYNSLLEQFGPELYILVFMDLDKLRNSEKFLLAEALERMRKNEVIIVPGFDGKFGTVKIFQKNEIENKH
jgi:DNA helicase II / ATP-dependent DNA helicase PcrA